MFEPSVVEPAAAFLASSRGAGSRLEFGIGTGRVALALAAAAVTSHGIELSADMVASRSASRGRAPDVTVGDFATTSSDRPSPSPTSCSTHHQPDLPRRPDRVLPHAAAHLATAGVRHRVLHPAPAAPAARRDDPPFDVTSTHLGFEEYDFATQIASRTTTRWRRGRYVTSSAPFRYVWPSELDLMARLAGMSLEQRWASLAERRSRADSGATSRSGARGPTRAPARRRPTDAPARARRAPPCGRVRRGGQPRPRALRGAARWRRARPCCRSAPATPRSSAGPRDVAGAPREVRAGDREVRVRREVRIVGQRVEQVEADPRVPDAKPTATARLSETTGDGQTSPSTS